MKEEKVAAEQEVSYYNRNSPDALNSVIVQTSHSLKITLIYDVSSKDWRYLTIGGEGSHQLSLQQGSFLMPIPCAFEIGEIRTQIKTDNAYVYVHISAFRVEK